MQNSRKIGKSLILFARFCVRVLKWLRPVVDVPVQQCGSRNSVVLLLKLFMKVVDKHITVQFKSGLLSPFGSFPPKFMNSGRACQLSERDDWKNKFMNPIRNRQEWFRCFDGCASTNPSKAQGWRKLEERMWEIYWWRAMDPKCTGLEAGKAAGCIHQRRLPVLPAAPPRPSDHCLSVDLVLRCFTRAECA